MDICPLRSEGEYDLALDEIRLSFENEPEPGSAEASRFNSLAAAIAEYEGKHWPIKER